MKPDYLDHLESEAIHILREVAGHHLDPQFVELLIQNIDQALAINERFPD